ncbi:MAG: hypothetical protein PF541_15395 [Prolixibacteraceae bacterium]|jgi:hypothetical protein|nr:hypothetical protein [Prolixibacteraceae bacterium]
MFFTILKHLHSGFRWIVLLLILEVILISVYKLITKKEYSNLDKKIGLFTMVFTHVQFLIGIVLYFISSKVVFTGESMSSDLLRFFLVEHIGMMLIAIVLITVGYSKVKRALESKLKFKRSIIFYGVSLFVILLAIPWPWQELAASWF